MVRVKSLVTNSLPANNHSAMAGAFMGVLRSRSIISFVLWSALLAVLQPVAFAGFKRDKMTQVVCGKTSEAEVLRLFGKPKTMNDNADGSKSWIYQEGKFIPSTIFSLQLNATGTVINYSLQEFNVGFGSVFKGKKLDPDVLEKIREFATTETDVTRLLGKPMLKISNSDGTKMYTYIFGRLSSGHNESRVITVDRTGVVSAISGGKVDLPKGDREIDEKRWALLVEGRSTEKEVIDLLGQPQGSSDLPDGTRSLVYFNSDSNTHNWLYYSVQIADGIVLSLNRFSSSWDPEKKLMTQGYKIDPDRWKAITPGATTDAEAIEWFGPPMASMPSPDGRKTYLYQYVEGRSLADFLRSDTRSIIFDARGVVTAAVVGTQNLRLQARPLDTGIVSRWTRWESEKPAVDVVKRELGEPSRIIESPEKTGCYLYLYESGPTTIDIYWVRLDAEGRWLGLIHSQRQLRELNAVGRKYSRARWNAFRQGQTSSQEVTELLGAPSYQLESTEGESMWIYLTGEVVFFPQSGQLPQMTQSYSVCELSFTRDGLLKSMKAD